MMEKYDFARVYFMACDRICTAAEDMYEKLFTDSGDPICDREEVESVIKAFQKTYRLEIDMIRQIAIDCSDA